MLHILSVKQGMKLFHKQLTQKYQGKATNFYKTSVLVSISLHSNYKLSSYFVGYMEDLYNRDMLREIIKIEELNTIVLSE